MSFRKRNVGIAGLSSRTPQSPSGYEVDESLVLEDRSSSNKSSYAPGVRPSPIDGRSTTSTGTQSLDNLLAGHAGFALGNSILIEESRTTDYAGTLLRYYGAEGVVQGHEVHVVGVGEHWGRELPGLVSVAEGSDGGASKKTENTERMRIAWRYERLGEFGSEISGSRAPSLPSRNPSTPSSGPPKSTSPSAFCHSFDLTKRLVLPSSTAINFIPIQHTETQTSPFTSVIQALSQRLSSSKSDTIHRLVFPSLLSPAFYPPHASSPKHILQFLHCLRSLLRQYPLQLTAMLSLPLTLYPRTTGLVRWMELLSDGVIELVPFPHVTDTGPSMSTSGAATVQEDKPHGMVKIHRLPVFHERGGGGAGGAGVGDDLAFTVSRRKFVIKPFSLPPVEGDTEAQRGETEGGKMKIDIDF